MGADCKSCCRCGFIILICAVGSAIVGAAIYSFIHTIIYDSSSWVSLYVQDLYVASAAPSLNNNGGSVSVELRFERGKALRGIGIGEFEMTLFYAGSEIGSSMVEGFSMRREVKRVDVIGKVEAAAMPWHEALLPGNVGTMVVELRWPSSNDKSRYTADVPVDTSGHMKIKGPILFEFHQA